MDVCEDIECVIASFSNINDAAALKYVSHAWNRAALTAPLAFSGPLNGDTFSLQTLRTHGPRPMPFVRRVLLECRPNDVLPAELLDALRALEPTLRPKFKRRYEAAITINRDFLVKAQDTAPAVVAWLETIAWDLLVWDGQPGTRGLKATTKEACMDAASYLEWTNLTVTHTLTLIDYTNNEGRSISAVQKAFSAPIATLNLFGVLTDRAMGSLALLDRPNKSLASLMLLHQGCCTWDPALVYHLQRACPGLRKLAIQGSNLIRKDLTSFNWTLWPQLRVLNLENNFTLAAVDNWPMGLTGLLVANTGLNSPALLPVEPTLQTLSCNMTVSQEWLTYFHSQPLQSLCVHLQQMVTRTQADYVAFWANLDAKRPLQRLGIRHLDRFGLEAVFESLRKVCQNTLVQPAIHWTECTALD